jgi:hypothetical protein
MEVESERRQSRGNKQTKKKKKKTHYSHLGGAGRWKTKQTSRGHSSVLRGCAKYLFGQPGEGKKDNELKK